MSRPSSIADCSYERSGSESIIFTHVLQRKTNGLIKKYVREYATLKLKHGGEAYVEFRSSDDLTAKPNFVYYMKDCVGVNRRLELDHARANWPREEPYDSCFIVTDKDNKKFLYLIAENGKIASEWTCKLRQYLNKKVKISGKKEGELGINDMIGVIELLEKNNFPSKRWKILGRFLGLWEDTMATIEDCYEGRHSDCLQECLSKWLRHYDDVDQRGGTTLINLTKCLKSIQEEETAKAVEQNTPLEDKEEDPSECGDTEDRLPFSKKDKSIGVLGDSNSGNQPLEEIVDHDRPRARSKAFSDSATAQAWKNAGFSQEYKKAVSTLHKNKQMESMFQAVTLKMEKIINQDSAVSFLAEISFLSQEKRSCYLKVSNNTQNVITFLKSFIVRGKAAEYIDLNENIPAQSYKGFSFKKYTSHSLDGCAAMLVFSITLLSTAPVQLDVPSDDEMLVIKKNEMKKCYFLVAFRNYTLQFTKKSKSKAVLLLIDGHNDKETEQFLDPLLFARIMRNQCDKPTDKDIPRSYQGTQFNRTFMFVGNDGRDRHDFGDIIFDLSMTGGYHSMITLNVSFPPPKCVTAGSNGEDMGCNNDK